MMGVLTPPLHLSPGYFDQSRPFDQSHPFDQTRPFDQSHLFFREIRAQGEGFRSDPPPGTTLPALRVAGIVN